MLRDRTEKHSHSDDKKKSSVTYYLYDVDISKVTYFIAFFMKWKDSSWRSQHIVDDASVCCTNQCMKSL